MKIFNYLILTLLLSSCTIYMPKRVAKNHVPNHSGMTHSERMGQYDTKKDVIRKFGFTNDKQNEEGIEIWYYNFGAVTNSNTRISGNQETNIKSNYSGVNVKTDLSGYENTTTSSYNKFAEFQFEGDRVINWRTKGLDYGNFKKDNLKRKKTWAYIYGALIDYTILVTVGNGIIYLVLFN